MGCLSIGVFMLYQLVYEMESVQAMGVMGHGWYEI